MRYIRLTVLLTDIFQLYEESQVKTVDFAMK